MPGLVCIVILNWNQCQDTIACLKSLSQITYPLTKTVVIDNGSTDNSREYITQMFPEIEFIPLGGNAGCSGGRNVGLQYANSLNADFILFLDNDTIVDSLFLTYLVNAMNNDKSIGIVSAKILVQNDRNRCWTAGGYVNSDGTVEALYYYQPSVQTPNEIFDVDWVPGCVLCTRLDTYKLVGSFDNTYFIYFEDVDWCVRAKKCGFRVVVEPQSIVYHKVSQSSGGDYSPRKLYYMARNRLIFIRKQMNGFLKWRTIISLVSDDIKDAIGDIFLMKEPKHAWGRCMGILHFFLGRNGIAPDKL